MKILAALFALLLLSACGSGGGMSGEYKDDTGVIDMKFDPGGEVTVYSGGVSTSLSYEVDGDVVKIKNGKLNMILKKAKDGTLTFPEPMGMSLVLKKTG